MGRVSKQHKILTSNVLAFLLEPESIQKNLQAGLKVLESYAKTRNSQRKQRFKEELTNVLKHLCVDSYESADSLQEAKKKIRGFDHRLREKDEHAQDWKNKCISLEMKISDSLEYRKMYEDQKKANRNIQRDYCGLYRENNKLRERIEELKQENKALKKEVKVAHKNQSNAE